MAYNVLIGCLIITLLSPLAIADANVEVKLMILYTTGLAILHAVFYCGFLNVTKRPKVAMTMNWSMFVTYIAIVLGTPMVLSMVSLDESQHVILTSLIVAGIFFNNLYLTRKEETLCYVASSLYGGAFALLGAWLVTEGFEWTVEESLAYSGVTTAILWISTTYILSHCVRKMSEKVGAYTS